MEKVPEYFGCMVFDDREMKARLSKKVYSLCGKPLMKAQSWTAPWPTLWQRQ